VVEKARRVPFDVSVEVPLLVEIEEALVVLSALFRRLSFVDPFTHVFDDAGPQTDGAFRETAKSVNGGGPEFNQGALGLHLVMLRLTSSWRNDQLWCRPVFHAKKSKNADK
jgi:hypothetical protein